MVDSTIKANVATSASSDVQTPKPVASANTYKVQAGDTLLDIANKFKVAYQQLRYYNNFDRLNPAIKEGQTIKIPSTTVRVPLGE